MIEWEQIVFLVCLCEFSIFFPFLKEILLSIFEGMFLLCLLNDYHLHWVFKRVTSNHKLRHEPFSMFAPSFLFLNRLSIVVCSVPFCYVCMWIVCCVNSFSRLNDMIFRNTRQLDSTPLFTSKVDRKYSFLMLLLFTAKNVDFHFYSPVVVLMALCEHFLRSIPVIRHKGREI